MKKNILLLSFLLIALCSFVNVFAKDPAREYYQITVYHFNSPEQEQKLDGYLRDAYLPALHRKKYMNIGVFKPIANDTTADKLLYVIVPFRKADQLFSITPGLAADEQFVTATQYYDTSYQKTPFVRMENIVLKAFSKNPVLTLPKLTGPRQDRVYELRSYESPTERFYRSKVKMFNEGGETVLFKRLNFNAVFYAEVIAGSRMPNLMYMTSFENKADRDAHWKSFSADPEWKQLSGLTEYQHNVSKSEIRFLRATDYSDY